MKIQEVRIQNFRCFDDETVSLSDYTCLVGPNGSGKSTILAALKVFFRDLSSPSAETLEQADFHHHDTSKPMVITVTFNDLEDEAQNDFADYYRQGLLIISAVASWDSSSRSATVRQFGQRLAMPAFKEFFEREQDAASLRGVYVKLRTTFTDLPEPGSKAAMIESLHNYEANHPESCVPIPSEDQFYGFTKGANRLQKYLQWICVPAVKDATSEQLEAKKNALGLLLERTVRSKMSFREPLAMLRSEVEGQYQKLLQENQAALNSLSESLTTRLKEWAHPDARLELKWHDEPAKYVELTRSHLKSHNAQTSRVWRSRQPTPTERFNYPGL